MDFESAAAPVPTTRPSGTAAPANLALGKPASQSSRSPWSTATDPQGAVDGVINGGFGFHTDQQINPWWQVDLGATARIDSIRIHNRLDCCSERARTLQVMLSDNGQDWRIAYRHNGSLFGGKDGRPLVVPLQGSTARYVRLQLNESNWFHLDEVEVIGTLSTASVPPAQGGPVSGNTGTTPAKGGGVGSVLDTVKSLKGWIGQ